jgi:hypothetical protein
MLALQVLRSRDAEDALQVSVLALLQRYNNSDEGTTEYFLLCGGGPQCASDKERFNQSSALDRHLNSSHLYAVSATKMWPSVVFVMDGCGFSSFKNVSPLVSHAVPNARSAVVSKQKTVPTFPTR